jgi:PAS domain S-box-containing protein
VTDTRFTDYLHPDKLPELVNRYNRRMAGEDVTPLYETVLRHKEGRNIDVEISAGTTMYSGKVADFIIIRDITDRKRAEEALKESEERLKALIENAPDGIYVIAPTTGQFIDGNRKAEELIGYPKEELIGRNFVEVGILPEEYIPKALEGLEKSRQGQPTGPDEYQLIRKDGFRVFVEIMSFPIARKGKTEIIGIARGISDRKQAEEEQKKLEAQLRRSQKMEAIGTLAGGVAHDLNNILAGLVSYPELLLMEMPEDSPLRNTILTIQKSGEKAAAVVQDLLTLARRGVATMEVVNLNHIVSDYLKGPEHEKMKSLHPNVHVETHLEINLLNILGSPVHLSKTVMNLVSNAAEAMPVGGTIFISTENTYIDRPLRGYDDVREGDYVILTISDAGLGISSKDIDRIFEPFYTKKAMGRSGTGLGMAVVWGTVKDHKGYIDVQSSKGKGTIFTLYFPIARKEVIKEKSLVSIKDYMARGESILVVDDVEEQREIASRMLKKLGYSVTTVSSGEEAVDYLKDNSADLLVLDMIMDPGIDGLETYKRILEFHPGQKAIILSGFSETDRVKEAQRLGAGAYVKKPFVLEKIGMAVRTELDI